MSDDDSERLDADRRYNDAPAALIVMQPINVPAETLAAADPASRALVDTARVANANAAILNNLLFPYLDYAAIGHRSGSR